MEVEHEQLGVEVEPGRGRAVEHPSQRPLAQVLERERGAAGVGGEPLAASSAAASAISATGANRTAAICGSVGSPVRALADGAQRLAQRRRLDLASADRRSR